MSDRPARILVVDDELDMAESVRRILARAGYEVVVEAGGTGALARLNAERFDLAVTDMQMPDMSGLELIEALRERKLDLPVIVLTGFATVDTAVRAMKLGAADYLAKPFAAEELLLRVEKALAWGDLTAENHYLRERVQTGGQSGPIVGRSASLDEPLRIVEKVAPTDARVLIVGESGTGKELFARTIHALSPRSRAAFFGINCGSLTESLLESELFGHERGSFTGAITLKKGIFELAEDGTLFLDDITETSPSFQTKLLRVVQEGEFMRVGGSRTLHTNARIISATNRDPAQALAEGKLREDLFYRLRVVQVSLPPLRARSGDIPLLVEHFVERHARHFKKRVRGIEPAAMAALTSYRWPGNIRELENLIERAVVLLDDGDAIDLDELPPELVGAAAEPVPLAMPQGELRAAERDAILRALRDSNWNRSLAAKRLGIGRRTLYDKIARHSISLHPTA